MIIIPVFRDVRERLKLKDVKVDHFMVQILSEHSLFKTYLFIFGIVEDNLCNDTDVMI